ncbi:LruC domain-containing protein [Leptospira wolffii]|uniref:LruC domain-containing protein n=1 Tax=Leptospira wolffii TaxID=409998 RepID=A0ABV5BNW7_9LEPT
MKKFLVLVMITGFIIQCSNKKKGGLFPFLFFLGSPHSSGGVPGNSGSPGVIFVPGDGSGNPATPLPNSDTPSDSNTGTTPTDNNSNPSTSPSTGTTPGNSGGTEGGTTTTPSNSNTGGDSSGNTGDNGTGTSGDNGSVAGGSGSTDSGNTGSTGNSGSTGGSDNSSGSGDVSNGGGTTGGSTDPSSSNPTTPSEPTPEPPVAIVVVEDPKGTPDFNYNTTINIPLNLTVVDNKSNPVSGATVLVYDENNNILFQGVSDSSGKVTGTLTVPTSVGNITVDISIGGESISQYISLQDLLGINRTIRYAITLPTNPVTDSDGDGVPDETDIYPNDATRSTEIAYPTEGVYTVAYEDLYPSSGDADFNDYVIEFKNQEDLNASGKIVRLRGIYQHVAKGAGYKHQLFIKLPVPTGAKVTYKLAQADGKVETDTTTTTVSANQLNSGFEIFPDSNKTIRGQNVHPGDVFKPGFVATIEIVFDTPVERAKLGAFPYDLFAYVINTKQEIHFPGLYKNSNGTDKYLDSTGFPWAILLPGAWKYPYEKYDIRKPSETGYAEFNLWVSSGGKEYKTWYLHVTDESKVFPVPNPSGLLGYLFLSVKKFAIFYAIGLVLAGGIAAYFLRKRHSLTA